MSKIYIAARYAVRESLHPWAQILSTQHDIVSSWLTRPEEEAEEAANVDVAEVRNADVLILVADASGGNGGRHTEFGMALVLDQRLIVVGQRENIFHSLHDVEVYGSWYIAIPKLIECVQCNGPVVCAYDNTASLRGTYVNCVQCGWKYDV
jgi:hypothetical protein